MPAPPPTTPPAPPAPYDFSIVLGGPFYQWVRRAHLTSDALELVRRRIIAAVLITWVPLLILSTVEGRAWGGAGFVPFFKDLEVHVRFLVALPLLIIAELVVHARMRPLVRQFLERNLVAEPSRARFDEAVDAALRLRNSWLAEAVLVATVYIVGLGVLAQYAGVEGRTWAAITTAEGRHWFAAGWWLSLVSLPIFQFMLLRWYFRLFIWIRFLWQVSRCRLSLVPTHPDGMAGLGFLSGIPVAFAPLLAAHGALLTAVMSGRILFHGATLTEFSLEIGVVVAFLLVVVLGPLLLFSPGLEQTRRFGLREYGTLAQRYVREFDDKWLRRDLPPGEAMLGSADIQSLADLGNSFDLVSRMQVVPFRKEMVVQLVVITLVPVAPMLLTMMPLEQLLRQLLQIVF
jgi:hypothetical protein